MRTLCVAARWDNFAADLPGRRNKIPDQPRIITQGVRRDNVDLKLTVVERFRRAKEEGRLLEQGRVGNQHFSRAD